MGAVIQSAAYKLNYMCNAGSLPQGRLSSLSSIRTRTTINYALDYTTIYRICQAFSYSILCFESVHLRQK